MRTQTKYHRQRPKNFTQKEKHEIYLQWMRSGQSKATFCQAAGMTKSTFYSWCHQFKQDPPSETVFSPVVQKATLPMNLDDVMQLEIWLPNQTKVCISMQKPNLVSFIQELCHATTVIR